MNRRSFLKMAGMGSVAFAAACSLESEKYLYSDVRTLEDQVAGSETWYASTCRQCPAGCGVLAKNREGRIIKLEGNPLHPINKGKLCMRGQAALQAVYHPDRLKTPLLKTNGKWRPVPYDQAVAHLLQKIRDAASEGQNRIRMITETEGRALTDLFENCMVDWQSPPPVVYEPLAHDHLKKANEIVFGIHGLASYRMEEADVLVSFGADFLETWLSPLEYAQRFNTMHRYRDGRKGRFIQISPCRTLTGANADDWISCAPGSEALICLGLIHAVLGERPPVDLPEEILTVLRRASAEHTPEKVARSTGISENVLYHLAQHLLNAEQPLVLGAGALCHSSNGLAAEIAVNLLNLILDPKLKRIDFRRRHRIESAGSRRTLADYLEGMQTNKAQVLMLNNVNPLFSLPPGMSFASILERETIFTVSFSNFLDETSERADLIVPVSMPLESWGEYGGRADLLSTLQSAMLPLNHAPSVADIFQALAGRRPETREAGKQYFIRYFSQNGWIANVPSWLAAIRSGGVFNRPGMVAPDVPIRLSVDFEPFLSPANVAVPESREALLALPSIRFYDGRGANQPWMLEIPDPITKVAWQTLLLLHPRTAREKGLKTADRVAVKTETHGVRAYVYETDTIRPGLLAMQIGQGHAAFGRYARDRGGNPYRLMPDHMDPISGAALFHADAVTIEKEGSAAQLARTDGSISQHGRKIALTIALETLRQPPRTEQKGLGMADFPLTLPLPEGYDAKRDFYPPHDHAGYRWAMVVDLDRCIGCNACAAACYAENNLGVVGEEQIADGREMSWMRIERYRQRDDRPDRLIFLPMLCQHCDNAPCESVCPVYAPHHSKEGLNNQIYNRCIGTRFCAQNCPYKVRRFNWFDAKWPRPLNLQLNPDVTVRSKGVMEKCSFCIQRIKAAHGFAKNAGRGIRDGEVTPACVQTCPTNALTFGSLMDKTSRVSEMVRDRRAYQVLGYLNTKPAVVYLKKVVHATAIV